MADVPDEFQVQTKRIICGAELIQKNANDATQALAWLWAQMKEKRETEGLRQKC